MKILIVTKHTVPPLKYGGTERVVFWLAKGLSELGHNVTVIAKKGSYVNEKVTIAVSEELDWELIDNLRKEHDITHFNIGLKDEVDFPYIQTQHGNCYKKKGFLPRNTIFVSQKHAQNHGRSSFVYNGIDVDEYEFQSAKEDYFAFLSKTNVKNKNVKYAIELAKKTKNRLKIGGGYGFSFNPKIRFCGMVGGHKKNTLLKNAKGLIFPTNWEEPFGLVVPEALACGTPVIVSDKGAMPELVTQQVGFVCSSEAHYLNAIEQIESIDPQRCREFVQEHFSYSIMAAAYVKKYEEVLNNGKLK